MVEIFKDIVNSFYLELCSMWNNHQWEKFVAWAVAGYFAVQAIMRGYTAAGYAGSKVVSAFRYLFIPKIPDPGTLCQSVCRMLEHGECRWDDAKGELQCGDLLVHCISGHASHMKFAGYDLYLYVNEPDKARLVEFANKRVLELMQQAREDKINQMILSAGKHYRDSCMAEDCACAPPPADDVPIIAKMTPALADMVNPNCGWLPGPDGAEYRNRNKKGGK